MPLRKVGSYIKAFRSLERLVCGICTGGNRTCPVAGKVAVICRLEPATREVDSAPGSEMELAHMRTVEEVLEQFKVAEEDGLTPERVTELREQYGANGEAPPPGVTPLQRILKMAG